MNSIKDPISKTSLVIITIYVYVFLMLLNLSLFEITSVIIIDLISCLAIIHLEKYLFSKLHPTHSRIFKNFSHSLLLKFKEEEDVNSLKMLFDLPSIRASFLFFINLIKVLPAGIYFIYYCDHGYSLLEAWSIYIALELFLITIFSGITFIELHQYLTSFTREAHYKYDLSSLYDHYQVDENIRQFKHNELIALGASSLVLVVQISLLSSTSSLRNGIDFTVIVLIGLVLLCRIYYLYRQYFQNGIERIYSKLDLFGEETTNLKLPLSSSKLLSKFENTFNKLSSAISKREDEISQWILNETESSRYRTIGEVSARIGHDIKGPLHAISYCAEQLKESDPNNKYIIALKENLSRVENLTNNLNSHLRTPDDKYYSNFLEVHHDAYSSLRIELTSVDKVKFELENLNTLTKLVMPHSELVSIFYNLYKNSISNFSKNKNTDPAIKIEIYSSSENHVHLMYKDNGSGLSKVEFDRLTQFHLDKDTSDHTFRRGLGLRLTKKIIEIHRGSLEAIDDNSKGATFMLKLPVRSSSCSEKYSVPDQEANHSHNWMN